MRKIRLFFAVVFLSLVHMACGNDTECIIVNGVPWFDNNGNIVNAHGACIVEDGGRYYLFGEWKSDTSNAFPGFSCYSSDDLVNWTFERVALPLQKDGYLGPNRVGERVKVMKCPQTGEYVMLMHTDDMEYRDPYICYATSDKINGEYTFKGPLTFNGEPINRWDMGTFQDEDGEGYLLIHHGPIYKLSSDYHSIEEQVAYIQGMGESPAMFKKNGMYYMLTSNLTSWEKNDNFYFTATKIEGPWAKRGFFCPEGTLTYNSQSTFVFMLPDGTPMYMGDRWSYPHQASAATYVWMPLVVKDTLLSIPEFYQSWDVKIGKAVNILKEDGIILNENVKTDNRNYWSLEYNGERIAIYGKSTPHSGYAKVKITDMEGNELFASLVDFYSLVVNEGIRFITPQMSIGKYILRVDNINEYPTWTDKANKVFGSDGTDITIDFFQYVE